MFFNALTKLVVVWLQPTYPRNPFESVNAPCDSVNSKTAFRGNTPPHSSGVLQNPCTAASLPVISANMMLTTLRQLARVCIRACFILGSSRCWISELMEMLLAEGKEGGQLGSTGLSMETFLNAHERTIIVRTWICHDKVFSFLLLWHGSSRERLAYELAC